MEWNLKLIYKDKDLFYKDLKRIDSLADEIFKLKGSLDKFECYKKYS